MRLLSSPTTDLQNASMPMQASCGHKSRMVSPMASCRDPRSILPSACASSSEAKLVQLHATKQEADRVDPPVLSEPSMPVQLGRLQSSCHLAICVRLREIECERRNRVRMVYRAHLRSPAGP